MDRNPEVVASDGLIMQTGSIPESFCNLTGFKVSPGVNDSLQYLLVTEFNLYGQYPGFFFQYLNMNEFFPPPMTLNYFIYKAYT